MTDSRWSPCRGWRAALWPLAVALFLAAMPPVGAQSVVQDQPRSSDQALRVGVALSGGGAKGFAHIGVLEALERAGVPIDVVGGTSMGSIVGGLYAVGYSPAMLRRVAETEDWNGVFRASSARDELSPARKLGDGRYLFTVPIRRGSPDLPTALVSSQNVASILSRLVWVADTVRDLRTLPIPFVAIATDLATGEAVPLVEGPLSAAMRASMALPGVFAPVNLRGRRLIDGGVARNLPAQDARRLGADILICVDVSDRLEPADSLNSAFGILMQVITYRMEASVLAERSSCDVVIDPDIRGLSAVAFDRGSAWIERGAEAAEAAMPGLLSALAARGVTLRPAASARESVSEHPLSHGRLDIREVRVVGDSLAPPTAGLLAMVTSERAVGGTNSLDGVDAGRVAARLFASGRYALVASHPVSVPGGTDLELDVVPANPDWVGLGIRFDTRYRAGLLLGGQLHDRLGAGSALSFDARLGEELLFEARYQPGAADAGWLVRSMSASFTRAPLGIYVDDRAVAVAEARVQVLRTDAFIGLAMPANTVSGLQIAAEAGRSSATIAPVAVDAVSQRYFTVSALSWTETFDRAAFPTRGLSLFARAEVADRRIGSGASFSRMVVDGEARVPVHATTTVLGHVTLGSANGDDLPLYNRFFLGGTLPSAVLPGRSFALPAIDPGARSGRAIQVAGIGVQQQIRPKLFLTARASAGSTFEHWPGLAPVKAYTGGVSLSIGFVTLLGPANVTVAGRKLDERPRLAAELGYRF